ncbi:hypothetical protein J4439_02295 [Candidatus Woesearchaeota archaeon]|nr:hypothetical protein [Candidatus Woesearchaeota archaeon]
MEQYQEPWAETGLEGILVDDLVKVSIEKPGSAVKRARESLREYASILFDHLYASPLWTLGAAAFAGVAAWNLTAGHDIGAALGAAAATIGAYMAHTVYRPFMEARYRIRCEGWDWDYLERMMDAHGSRLVDRALKREGWKEER